MPIESLGIAMGTQPEYNVRELGPWDRESDTLFYAPDPVSNGQTHVWWDMGDGQYMDCSGCPILFEGREPRDRGYPLPVDESEVGTPLQQWECELRMSSPEEWYQYRMNGWGW